MAVGSSADSEAELVLELVLPRSCQLAWLPARWALERGPPPFAVGALMDCLKLAVDAAEFAVDSDEHNPPVGDLLA